MQNQPGTWYRMANEESNSLLLRTLTPLQELMEGYCPILDLCDAFDIGQTKARDCVKKYLKSNCSVGRKQRSDCIQF